MRDEAVASGLHRITPARSFTTRPADRA